MNQIDPAKLEFALNEHDRRQIRRQAAPTMSYGRHDGPPSHNARHAAVLILICPTDKGWAIPMTRRQPHLAAHAGQISFPGGSVDAGESSWQAACREAEEELGIPRRTGRMLGQLHPLYLFNSNFLVDAWIAWTSTAIHPVPSSDEVAELIWVPISDLVESDMQTTKIRRGGFEFSAPAFTTPEATVWGATHVLLREFTAYLQLVKTRTS